MIQQTNELKQVGNIDTKGHNSIWGRIYSPDGIAPNLNSEGGGLGAKTGLIVIGHTRSREKDAEGRIGIEYHEKSEFGSLKGPSGNQQDFLGADGQIRRLTPTECERLQGFPDGWTKAVSDTQRYKLMGNAVSVPVITAIGERILETLSA